MTTPPDPPWLDDPDAPPTPEEQAEAEALARALSGQGEHPTASFAEALRAAHAPRPLPPAEHERLLTQAIDKARPPGRLLAFPARRAALLGALAAAACLALVLGRGWRRPLPVALVASRSAQELFDEQFPKQGHHSERVGRIASARGRELRANRFAQWGVP